MAHIHVLEDHIANQIAAGEVVERPASVVKELVENAIDAGAKSIHVTLEKGGLSRMEVQDDGNGIASDELRLAFLRHATSKIGQTSDLYSLNTMGFRGEALPSIAAVSRIHMVSRQAEQPSGQAITIEGGRIVAEEPQVRKPGTTVEVRDLFFNTPVRKKFLKAEHLEKSVIVDYVQKLALSHTTIAFSLIADGKTLFRTRGTGDLRETLAYVFPGILSEKLINIQEETDYYRIHGLIAPPYLYRASKDFEIFFVNRRYVQSKVLSAALEQAYRHRIPIRKYPMGVLHIEMNPAAIDVNIHPSKIQVKFSMEETIRKELVKSVEKALMDQSEIRALPQKNQGHINSMLGESEWSKAKIDTASIFTSVNDQPREIGRRQETFLLHQFHREKSVDVSAKPVYLQEEPSASYEAGQHDTIPVSTKQEIFIGYEVLTVISRTYAVLKKEDDLYILDQHAAHERIRYEELRVEYQQETLKSQFLLEPVVLALSYVQKTKLVEYINDLNRLGIVVELFGDNEYLLRGVPVGLIGQDYAVLLEELLVALDENQESIKEKMLELAACHGAIRGGDDLHNDTIIRLLQSLGECEDPYTCPHGRPTIIRLGKKELEKFFLRDQ